MSTYKFSVKVHGRHLSSCGGYMAFCQVCGHTDVWLTLASAYASATRHAATCERLHRANWEAACPSCKAYGRVAPACPVCLGRGFEREREGLE